MSQPPLHILYQDDFLVAIDKPAGYLVHPTSDPQEGDLVAMKILRDQIGQRVHTIHRIDRPTSGVLLFGVNKEAAHIMHKALENHEYEKIYWAVVRGLVPAESWECHEPIQKEESAPIRDAHTSFRLLRSRKVAELSDITLLDNREEGNNTLHLVEATPHSGRFHQIRRHLLHQDIPIVGDYRYAGIETSDRFGQLLGTGTRMLLQAKSLSIDHPITGEKLTIRAPVEEIFTRCFPALAEQEWRS